MKIVEYSLIVRRKIQKLRNELEEDYGKEKSDRIIRRILDIAGGLAEFPEKGVAVSARYEIECDYRYLYVGHNYLFYRVEEDKIIIVEMFDEKEDFMWKLFGMETTSQETINYWGED